MGLFTRLLSGETDDSKMVLAKKAHKFMEGFNKQAISVMGKIRFTFIGF